MRWSRLTLEKQRKYADDVEDRDSVGEVHGVDGVDGAVGDETAPAHDAAQGPHEVYYVADGSPCVALRQGERNRSRLGYSLAAGAAALTGTAALFLSLSLHRPATHTSAAPAATQRSGVATSRASSTVAPSTVAPTEEMPSESKALPTGQPVAASQAIPPVAAAPAAPSPTAVPTTAPTVAPTVAPAAPTRTAAPSPSPASAAATAAVEAAATSSAKRVHVVQPGDTLYSIARRSSTTVDALVAANGLGNSAAVLSVGRQLVIPG